MKKIITGVILLASVTFYGQNTFPPNANVGIGTNNPQNKIHIVRNQTTGLNNPSDNRILSVFENIGGSRILLGTDSNSGSVINFGDTDNWNSGELYYDHSSDQMRFRVNNANRMTILNNGNVGIGTTNPDKELTVAGTIHCEEVLVDLSVPADYVFQKYYTGFSNLKENYTMPTLEEVAAFTKENHHLPNVPSAATIQEEGLQLKEMTNILLQKIEELTLYTIEQEKRIKALEGKLEKKK